MGENGGVRGGDSVRIGHPKTIPHSHERIVAYPRMWILGHDLVLRSDDGPTRSNRLARITPCSSHGPPPPRQSTPVSLFVADVARRSHQQRAAEHAGQPR